MSTWVNRSGDLGGAWETREESLANGMKLYCFRRLAHRASLYDDRMWVYVTAPGKALSVEGYIDGHIGGQGVVDKVLIMPSDPLMMECVAHEMRLKYGAEHSE